MSIVARCKAAARLPTRRGRQPWRSSRTRDWRSRRFPLVDVGHCNAYDHPAQGRDAPGPPKGAQSHQAGGLQRSRRRDHVAGAPPAAGDARARLNAEEAQFSPGGHQPALALVLVVCAPAPRHERGRARLLANGDGRRQGSAHGDAGCRWAARRRLISSRRYPAPHEQQPGLASDGAPRRRGRGGGDSRAARARDRGAPRRRGVGRGSVVANDARRRGRAAAARACVVRLINHYKFFGLMLKPVTGPWGAGPS